MSQEDEGQEQDIKDDSTPSPPPLTAEEWTYGCLGIVLIVATLWWIISWWMDGYSRITPEWLCYDENQGKYIIVSSPIHDRCTKMN